MKPSDNHSVNNYESSISIKYRHFYCSCMHIGQSQGSEGPNCKPMLCCAPKLYVLLFLQFILHFAV